MGSLRAFLAFLGALMPTYPGARAPEPAPFVEVVETTASVAARPGLRQKSVRARAEEEALGEAVSRVARLYAPAMAGSRRMEEAEAALARRPRGFVHRYRVLDASVGPSSATVTVEAMVLGDRVREAMFARGLRKPGERLEMAVLASTLSGGDGSRDDAGGGHAVLKRPFDAGLLGLMVRYYFSDDAFAEASWQTLTRPVEVGSYFTAAGARSSVTLRQYSPLSASVGVDVWRWRGLRLGGSAGVGAVNVAIDLTPAVPGRVRDRAFLFSPFLAVGLQWAPSAHFGLGLRSEYRPTGPMDCFVSVPLPALQQKAEAMFAF
ncbi:MAG: hypothetical protein HY928_13965 [Elusimicrobia bacterium]|nr:hypothetical protein [Elusimicrobiota bacterium]